MPDRGRLMVDVAPGDNRGGWIRVGYAGYDPARVAGLAARIVAEDGSAHTLDLWLSEAELRAFAEQILAGLP